MSTLSIKKSRNLESPAPKKGSAKSHAPSRRKVTSAGATANKTPRSVESKAARVAAAKTPMKADEPNVERVTKQERVLKYLFRLGVAIGLGRVCSAAEIFARFKRTPTSGRR